MTLLETSGHRPLFEQPDRFREIMARLRVSRSGSALDSGRAATPVPLEW
jgi:hypothetical protein